MTTEHRKFLTADKDGFALYSNDLVYSEFHKKLVVLESIYVDAADGEVFLTCNEGTLRVKHAHRLKIEDLQRALDSLDKRSFNTKESNGY